MSAAPKLIDWTGRVGMRCSRCRKVIKGPTLRALEDGRFMHPNCWTFFKFLIDNGKKSGAQ